MFFIQNPYEAILGFIGTSTLFVMLIILLIVQLYRRKRYAKLIIYNEGFIDPMNKDRKISLDEILKVRYFPPSNYFKFYLKDWYQESVKIYYSDKNESKELYRALKKLGLEIVVKHKLS